MADAEAGRYCAGFREGIELRSTVSREVAIRKAISDLREGAPLALKQSHIGNPSFLPDRGFAQSHRSIYLIDLCHKTGLRGNRVERARCGEISVSPSGRKM